MVMLSVVGAVADAVTVFYYFVVLLELLFDATTCC